VAVFEWEGREQWLLVLSDFTSADKNHHVVSVKLHARTVMLSGFIWGENLPIHHLFCFPRRMWLFFNSFAAYSTYKNNVGNKSFLSDRKFGNVGASSIIHTANVDGLQELG